MNVLQNPHYFPKEGSVIKGMFETPISQIPEKGSWEGVLQTRTDAYFVDFGELLRIVLTIRNKVREMQRNQQDLLLANNKGLLGQDATGRICAYQNVLDFMMKKEILG